jgi:Ni2+-binding GTPase involved in maturation of urease and hydrogenase
MKKPLHLHLVAGFLGSGKTTAIVNACKTLVEQGKRVGVITNDQGKYLVDTAFLRLQDFPAVEVGGGCFCCNFVDLEKELGILVETVKPDVIFAESVGSCADLVATVVKPMLQLQGSLYQPTSYSTFVDVRLLRMRLNDIPLPFSDGVVYIFDKQLEETNLLVINKMDLLPENQRNKVLQQVQEAYPDKVLFPQTSLEPEGVKGWLELMEAGKIPLPAASLEIDYNRYGNGERQLAWLDEELVFDIPDGSLRTAVVEIMRAILEGIQGRNAPIGHIKTVWRGSGGGETKFSFTTQVDPGWEKEIPELLGSQLTLLLNARVELPAEDLKTLVYEAVKDSAQKVGAGWRVAGLQAFHPGYPKPTYRLK